MKHIDLKELEEFARTHTVTEIREAYGENGYRLCRLNRFSYVYKTYVRTKPQDPAEVLRKQRIEQDIREGLPLSYIAKIYNCSRQYIFEVKEKMQKIA